MLEVPHQEGSHGGGDQLLRADLFARPWEAGANDRMATLDDAVQAVLIGAAANASIAEDGARVRVQDLLEQRDE